MNKKHKKLSTFLAYIKHPLILASMINRRVSISAFASLVGILIGTANSAVGLKICSMTAVIKNNKSIIKKKKKP